MPYFHQNQRESLLRTRFVLSFFITFSYHLVFMSDRFVLNHASTLSAVLSSWWADTLGDCIYNELLKSLFYIFYFFLQAWLPSNIFFLWCFLWNSDKILCPVLDHWEIRSLIWKDRNVFLPAYITKNKR